MHYFGSQSVCFHHIDLKMARCDQKHKINLVKVKLRIEQKSRKLLIENHLIAEKRKSLIT